MATANLTWNPNTCGEETRLVFGKSWYELTNIEKADFLQDSIHMLKQEYRAIMKYGLLSA